MKIIASITGYGSEPISLAAFLDHATGVLAIIMPVNYREARDSDMAFVTNTKAPDYDCLFQEEHLADAIRAFREAEGTGMIALSDTTQRFRPRIETDGVNESGQKYRLHPDLNNGEVAVLALAHFMQRQRAVHNVESAMDAMLDIWSI